MKGIEDGIPLSSRLTVGRFFRLDRKQIGNREDSTYERGKERKKLLKTVFCRRNGGCGKEVGGEMIVHRLECSQ